MSNSNEDYKKADEILNKIISKNLKALLASRDLSQSQFCRLLASKRVCITRSYFNKILNNPQHISITFLLSCCDFFGITLQNLCSTNFNAEEYVFNDTESHQEYLNIQELMKEYNKQQTSINSSIKNNSEENDNFLHPLSNTNLITDPKNILFSGYIQKYYCYFYPTNSSENKNKNNILKGSLHLKEKNNYCEAILKIDTGVLDKNGETYYKIYTGYAVISTTVHSLTCILYSDFLCEFCLIMFRHSNVNSGNKSCRLAEILSSSSGSENKRPTVLRMLLSKEDIKDEDLEVISPGIELNYSDIVITEENLCNIRNISESYKKTIDKLTPQYPPKSVHFFKEEDIVSIAKQYLHNKAAIGEFLMQLRSEAFSYRYNKISEKADTIVEDILCSRGYYKRNVAHDKS